METIELTGRPIIPGKANGPALASSEPLSLWGGYDWHTGEIIDRRHELSGTNACGKILAIPHTRGSSTTTAVLLEAIRAGTAPRAILTTGPDSFFALASIVAMEMYARYVPLASLAPQDFNFIRSGDHIQLELDGRIKILRGES
jgi:predicted aconitase with swiveling domain